MIKKFLNWKSGLIIGGTSAIVISAIASPIVGKNAVTASYEQKLSQRTTDVKKAKSIQSFTFTREEFEAGVAKLQLKDNFKNKNKLTASVALELHNDKSYSFELGDVVDLSALKEKDRNMEFEIRTISKTEDASNPSVATADGAIKNIYVIGIDTTNNIYYRATGSIVGFLPDAQVSADNNYFVDGAQSSIKIKDDVEDKTATAVALELQKLFSQEISSLTPKSADATAPVVAPKAPTTTSAEGRRPKQAEEQATVSTTPTQAANTTPSKKLAQAFKAALAQIGGFNLKNSDGDFTFLPDSYYIEPVVDANNKLKFSNVNDINETLEIHVNVVGPDGTKLPTTLVFDNLGYTSEETQEKLIESFANSYKLKPGIAKALAQAHLGIADVVYAPTLPAQLASVAPFNKEGVNVKDFDFWFEKSGNQEFGSTLEDNLSDFEISIAQGDAAPSAEEIETLKEIDALKLSIQYQQHQDEDSSIPQGINEGNAEEFQAGTNIIVDTRGEIVQQLVDDSFPKLAESAKLAESVYVLKDRTGSTKTDEELKKIEAETNTFVDANFTQIDRPQGTKQETKEGSKPQIASKLIFDISPEAPILFANHLDTAIVAFNEFSTSNISLAVSQLAFLLDKSGNGAQISTKTYGQYIKDALTGLSSELPKGVTLALEGQFNKKTNTYTVYVKAMEDSEELKKYSFDITNVSAPNYAYDVASQYGANVFVDGTSDRLVGADVREQYKEQKSGKTNTINASITTTSKGVVLSKKDEHLYFADKKSQSDDTTLKNGTLWLAFKASALKQGIRTYFLESKESANGKVRLFIEKLPTTTQNEAKTVIDNKKLQTSYAIGISYDNVKYPADSSGTAFTGDIVALFSTPSTGTLEKTDHTVFQLLRKPSDQATTNGTKISNTQFKNMFEGDSQYGDFISKTNNQDDPTLLLEINIHSSSSTQKAMNFALYSSAIKDPLNNPIRSQFTQSNSDSSHIADKFSIIDHGIGFYSIGDTSFGDENNHITFKALGVFKDNNEYQPTQNAEVRRQIAKAFIEQYFTEGKTSSTLTSTLNLPTSQSVDTTAYLLKHEFDSTIGLPSQNSQPQAKNSTTTLQTHPQAGAAGKSPQASAKPAAGAGASKAQSKSAPAPRKSTQPVGRARRAQTRTKIIGPLHHVPGKGSWGFVRPGAGAAKPKAAKPKAAKPKAAKPKAAKPKKK